MTSEENTIKKTKRVFKKSKRKSNFDPKAKFGTKNKSQKHEEEIKEVDRKLREFNSENASSFEDFPLTQVTLKGLTECNYLKPTLIQKLSLPLALQGSNILGAAKTGSGKTLAFVIPVLEKLYRLKWSPPHGIGALIVTPTRELAEQIFSVFKKVGKYHNFSAGLIIGGRNVEKESRRLVNINIIISTPGRLLHHLRETYGFDLNTLQILVLDEADRMLDMGFKKELNNIIESIPDERQTLLYSATQTRCRTDLQRLNWKNYFLVCEKVTEKSELISMPTKLEQIYMVCEAEEKVNLLYSFIVQDVKRKLLVFMSTCKQVRFLHEAFQKINKDVTFLAIHGSMKQKKRSDMFEKFMNKRHCVMFATDVACRGLDFPAVDWVIQLDCPSDVETYVHRVGRTARYEDDGMSLMFLLPSEKDGMLKELETKGITLQEERPKKGKLIDIERKLESLIMDSQQWEDFARKCVLTYLKSVFYMKNKDIFNIQKINQAALAKSLGLHNTSKIQKEFVSLSGGEKKSSLKKRKRESSDEEELSDEDSEVKPLTKVQGVGRVLKKGTKPNRIVFNDETDDEKVEEKPQTIEERRKLLLEKDTEDNALSKQKRNKKKVEVKKKQEQRQREMEYEDDEYNNDDTYNENDDNSDDNDNESDDADNADDSDDEGNDDDDSDDADNDANDSDDEGNDDDSDDEGNDDDSDNDSDNSADEDNDSDDNKSYPKRVKQVKKIPASKNFKKRRMA